MLVAAGTLHAATWTWTGEGDGTTFSDAGNWAEDGAPPAATRETYVFSLPGGGNVTLDNNYCTAKIQFDAGAGSFTFGGSGTFRNATGQYGTGTTMLFQQDSSSEHVFNVNFSWAQSTFTFTGTGTGNLKFNESPTPSNGSLIFNVNTTTYRPIWQGNIRGSNNRGKSFQGSGTFELAGNSTYDSSSTISGTLTLLTSSANWGLGSSATATFGSGATLAGTGGLAGSASGVTMNTGSIVSPGIHGPTTSGDPVGVLSFSALTLNAGTFYDWDIKDTDGNAGTGWDLLQVQNLLTINSTEASKLTIRIRSRESDGTPGLLDGFDNTESYMFMIATSAVAVTGFDYDPANVAIDTNGFLNPVASGGWFVGLNEDGDQLLLAFDPNNVTPFTPPEAAPDVTYAVWSGGTTTNAPDSGLWSFSANWDDGDGAPGTVVSSNETHLIFGGESGAVAYTATLDLGENDDAFELNKITLNNQFTAANTVGITLARGVSSRTLLFSENDAEDAPRIVNNSAGQVDLTIPSSWGSNPVLIEGSGAGHLRIVEPFSGTGGLRHERTATIRLSASLASTLSGDIDINAGTLVHGSGQLPSSSVLLINSGTMVMTAGSNPDYTQTIRGISGNGGKLTHPAGNSMGSSTYTANVPSAEEYTYAGNIGADFSSRTHFIKTGTGTQILSGANSVTTTLNINNGTLQVDGSIGNGAASVNVNNNATLSGAGNIRRPVTVASGGTIKPGSAAGDVLTIGMDGSPRTLTLTDGFTGEYTATGRKVYVYGTIDLSGHTAATTINVHQDAKNNDVLFEFTVGITGANNGDTLNWTIAGVQNGEAVVDGNRIILKAGLKGTVFMMR